MCRKRLTPNSFCIVISITHNRAYVHIGHSQQPSHMISALPPPPTHTHTLVSVYLCAWLKRRQLKAAGQYSKWPTEKPAAIFFFLRLALFVR